MKLQKFIDSTIQRFNLKGIEFAMENFIFWSFEIRSQRVKGQKLGKIKVKILITNGDGKS
jgi:hypothetical protein